MTLFARMPIGSASKLGASYYSRPAAVALTPDVIMDGMGEYGLPIIYVIDCVIDAFLSFDH